MDSFAVHDIPPEICQRIAIAAEQLYEENGRAAFPSVDAVRRKARVNMNFASLFMKQWRRLQVAGGVAPGEPPPDGLRRAAQEFLAAVWKEATDRAAARLQAAQAGWDIERTEAEAARFQLAAAFDWQTDELQAAQSACGAMRELAAHLRGELQAVQAQNQVLLATFAHESESGVPNKRNRSKGKPGKGARAAGVATDGQAAGCAAETGPA